MTPERQRWWNNLPAEEKCVRSSIEWQQEIIAYNKALMNDEIFCDYDYLKKQIREAKRAIKALRKQIAQYPYRKDTHRVHCPNCWVWIVECYNEPPYCKYCGQKLRWKK